MDTSNLPIAALLLVVAVYLLLPQRWRLWKWLDYLVWWITGCSLVVYTIVGGEAERFNHWFPWILLSGIGAAAASRFVPQAPGKGE